MQAVARVLLLPSTVWLTPMLMAIGAIFGIAGTLLLKLDRTAIDTVFALYLISNIAWTIAAVRARQIWILLMNATYLVISILGVLGS